MKAMKNSAAAVALAAALIVSGCSAENIGTSAVRETSAESGSAVGTAESGTNEKYPDWDYDKFLKNDIAIDGKHIPLPCTLANWGEEYSYAETGSYDLDTEMYTIDVMKKGKKIAEVYVAALPGKLNGESTIYGVVFDRMRLKNADVKGISYGSVPDDIVRAFGEPSEKTVSDDAEGTGTIVTYVYGFGYGSTLTFVTSGEKIEMIMITDNTTGIFGNSEK